MTSRLRLVSVLLFASLAVNLFLGGLMIGRWLDPRHDGLSPRIERSRDDGGPPGWMRRAVGPDGAPVLEQVWRAHEPEVTPLRAELSRSRSAISDALEAEPFDVEAYDRALTDMREKMTRFHTAVHKVMVDVATRLTPEQRRHVVERSREWERRKGGPG